jgi:hypothetical protein
VYSNINAEGLAALGDCRPASVTTLVRMGHHAPEVSAVLAPEGLTMTIEPYPGGFVTSADFQRFNILIESSGPTVVDNPLGRFVAAAAGNALTIRQTFARPMGADARWFIFSRDRLDILPAATEATPPGPGRP